MNKLAIALIAFNIASAPTIAITPAPSPPITLTVVATAYSPRPQETDSTPYTTALGADVREGIIAANFLPFGTIIRIPDFFGDTLFTVADRMNRRFTHAYPHRIDIFYHETNEAMRFGRKILTIEIVKMPGTKTAERTSLRPLQHSDS